VGFEPTTTSLGGIAIDWLGFKEWVYNKYAKSWAPNVFRYAKTYSRMLTGDLTELEAFNKSKRNNILKSLIALSKYLGIYKQFKDKMQNYGVKWKNQNSLEAFIRILKVKDGLLEWIKTTTKVFDKSYATFVKFVLISGIRKCEAIDSFNLVVKLCKTGKLEEYYNTELQSLEHFRYEDTFIRGTKNAFFSFIPKNFIEQVASCDPISHSTLRRRLAQHGLNLRFSELRDYYATFMVHNGLIREEVDILQGRIGKSIFMRHYFSPNVKQLRDKTLKAVEEIQKAINNNNH